MKNYESPNLTIALLCPADIVRTSGTPDFTPDPYGKDDWNKGVK